MTRERDQQKFPSKYVVSFVSLLLCTWLGTIGPGAAQQTSTAPAPTSVVVPGTVQAFYATDLFAKESGYISQINADIGDQVKKNQVLAVIETPELQQQLMRSRAAVQQAAAALDVAKRRLTGLEADRALQQATLKRTEQLFPGKAMTGQ
jgi:multidrug efflux pump subunit AcrA (membrane-fusion protein)